MLEIVALLLQGLSAVAADPNFGKIGTSVKRLIDLASAALERGAEGAEDLKAIVAQLDVMVKEGREPSESEWTSLKARSDAAHKVIQDWKP